MSRTVARDLQQALSRLQARCEQDQRLHAESLRARREFFGPAAEPAATDPELRALAEQRFHEWFLLERDSAVLGAVPFEATALERGEHALADSVASVFAIQGCRDDRAEARDLQDDAAYELQIPRGAMQPSDVLVGRIYPRDDGSFVPSAAIALFRPGPPLAQAFVRDREQLGLERRLTQQELEQLLLRGASRPAGKPVVEPASPPGPPIERLEAELAAVLAAGGADHDAAAISAMLADVVRPGPVVDPLLEQLAFDSKVDLDRARELLLSLWGAHRALDVQADTAPPAQVTIDDVPGESLGDQMVRMLDEGLAKKQDLEELFAQLERMVGIEPEANGNPYDDEEVDDDDGAGDSEERAAWQGDDEDPDGDDPAARGAFGDLEPLITEYLWETGLEDSAAAATLRLWVELQHNAALPRTDVELVTGQDLMRVLLHVYLRAEPQQRAVAVRSAFADLSAFYGWVERTQELAPSAALATCHGALLDHLDRLEAAGRLLSTDAASTARPQLLHVEDLGKDGFGVRLDDGDGAWIQAPAATVAKLQVGDLLLGAIETRAATARLVGRVIALPPDAAALVG